jgi:DNA ligase 1
MHWNNEMSFNEFFTLVTNAPLDESEADMITVTIDGMKYQIVKSSEVIEAASKKGTKYWQKHIVRDARDRYYTTSASWATTKTGLSKENWSTPYYAEPKNIGRANETSSREQAESEYQSDINKQTRIRESTRPLPMLAQSYEKRKHKVKFPCAVQPKLDGVRMLSDGSEAWSRKNKLYLPEIIRHIFPVNTRGRILDGELMLPWRPPVNVTNSATKKMNENTPKLRYFVYDIIDPDYPDIDFITRIRILENWVVENGGVAIKFVETFIANDEAEVRAYHAKFTEQGYEGTIIRNLDSIYHVDKRVDDLLKFKDFIDAEFEIIDIVPAGGGSSSTVGKFVCVTENGDRFESTATGTEADRRELLENKHQYIGKFAKVKFREYTEYGIPFHSNTLEVRETRTDGY